MSGSELNMEVNEMAAPSLGDQTPLALEVKSTAIEEQLAHIIGSAREVAIIAEELLRDFTAQDISGRAHQRSVPHAVVLAPRLLAATQQQLQSLLSMMRTI